MEDVVRIGLLLGECVGLQYRQNLAAYPTQHRLGGALMLGFTFPVSYLFVFSVLLCFRFLSVVVFKFFDQLFV